MVFCRWTISKAFDNSTDYTKQCIIAQTPWWKSREISEYDCHQSRHVDICKTNEYYQSKYRAGLLMQAQHCQAEYEIADTERSNYITTESEGPFRPLETECHHVKHKQKTYDTGSQGA
jgi:hypothetical protein